MGRPREIRFHPYLLNGAFWAQGKRSSRWLVRRLIALLRGPDSEPRAEMIQGTIHSINVSDGGVPKLARPWAEVRFGGLLGDRQRDLRCHGGPERAVSLYSLELIRALQEEGHPIAPGSTGENITVTGLAWGSIRTGVRLRVGSAVLELTKPAPPCEKIAASFRDGEFARVAQKVRPGWSRFYSRVIQEGRIVVGDRVSEAHLLGTAAEPQSHSMQEGVTRRSTPPRHGSV
jgi:MOSC domain-containing protein YiiM